MRSETLTPERILAAAEREYAAVRAEMVRLARELWPAWRGGRAAARTTRARSSGACSTPSPPSIPRPDDLLDFCRAENARIEAFCGERDLIGLADEPLEIQWTPVFLRAFGGAMLSSPGPLDKGQKAFFAITPMPDDWTEEQRESNLREDNDRMLRLLTIHEAVPGHYLQGVYANRCPSIVRAIFASGLFAEGWAVYVTQVMMDVGYGADDPALMLVHWKFYLRSITNAIIDARIHCDGHDRGRGRRADGRRRLPGAGRGARQVRPGAAVVDPAVDLLRGLDRDVGRSSARSAGGRRSRRATRAARRAVPEPRVVGGFGETPGFSYRPHLESVIAHGAPPTSLLRRILLGLGAREGGRRRSCRFGVGFGVGGGARRRRRRAPPASGPPGSRRTRRRRPDAARPALEAAAAAASRRRSRRAGRPRRGGPRTGRGRGTRRPPRC